MSAKMKKICIQSICRDRIHPTQKPVKLYEWIFKNYAEPKQKIIDTHLGSGSSAIAAHHAELSFVGVELDEEYFGLCVDRYKLATAQKVMNL